MLLGTKVYGSVSPGGSTSFSNPFSKYFEPRVAMVNHWLTSVNFYLKWANTVQDVTYDGKNLASLSVLPNLNIQGKSPPVNGPKDP